MININIAQQVAVELIKNLFLPKMITGGYDYFASILKAEEDKASDEACTTPIDDFDAWSKAHLKKEILNDLYWHVCEMASQEERRLIYYESYEQSEARRAKDIGLLEQAKAATTEFDCINALANYEANNMYLPAWHKAFKGDEYESIDKIQLRELLDKESFTVGDYLEISGLFNSLETRSA